MALNIKNPEVERLVEEVVALTGESKTEAVRQALLERKARLGLQVAEPDHERLLRFLREEAWPQLPADRRGQAPSQQEQDEILGYGPAGVPQGVPNNR